jgi:hypothetical protein
MRTKGAVTNKSCWRCIVKMGDEELLNKDYTTLTSVGKDLGFTYHQVVEISNKRKKNKKGLYEPQYQIFKITDILNSEPEILFDDESDDDGQFPCPIVKNTQ